MRSVRSLPSIETDKCGLCLAGVPGAGRSFGKFPQELPSLRRSQVFQYLHHARRLPLFGRRLPVFQVIQ